MRFTRTAASRRARRIRRPGRRRRPDGAGVGRHPPSRRRPGARLRAGGCLRGAGRAAARHRRPVARSARQRGARAISSPSTPGATTACRWARSSSSAASRRNATRSCRARRRARCRRPAGSAYTRSTTTMSLATIVYACDADRRRRLPRAVHDADAPCRAPRSRASPERDNYARVLPGNDRPPTFGAGDFIVIDRGHDHGIAPGSQFVVYHDKNEAGKLPLRSRRRRGRGRPRDVGDPDTSRLRAIAVTVDDYVSMRK